MRTERVAKLARGARRSKKLAAWNTKAQSALEYERVAQCWLWYFWPWSGAKRRKENACKNGGDLELPNCMLLHNDQCGGARAQGPRDCEYRARLPRTRSPGHETRVAWRKAKRRFDKLKHPWKAVCRREVQAAKA